MGSEIREKRVQRRQHCQALAVLAVGHLYTDETKSDDPGWVRDEIKEFADFFESDLKRAEEGSLHRRS